VCGAGASTGVWSRHASRTQVGVLRLSVGVDNAKVTHYVFRFDDTLDFGCPLGFDTEKNR
jgi:hypothetical protein